MLIRTLRRSDLQHALWLLRHFEDELGGSLSARQRLPLSGDGLPFPWYPYAAIHFLEQLDFSKCTIFEYGSGNSSLFWSARARFVHSVEINPEWYEKMRSRLGANQSLTLATDENEYARKICDHTDAFNVIVIDGSVRRLCASYAIGKLDASGFIILENSDRYPETSKYLRERGFQQVDFIGAGPMNSYTWAASIFFLHGISIPRKSVDGGIQVRGGLQHISWDDSMEAIAARHPSDHLGS